MNTAWFSATIWALDHEATEVRRQQLRHEPVAAGHEV